MHDLTNERKIAVTTPISLHPENPHYFEYHGRLTVLVTSAEHYGAVLNSAFDFKEYLLELHRCGNNLTRVFIGTQREFPGSFYDAYNTLAPKPKDFLCPYQRSAVPGANDAQNKFDLDAWDEAFFQRLELFMQEAERLEIIVELAFFCPFYREALGNATWNLSPYHPDNNINGIGAAGLGALFTWQDDGYVRVMTRLIQKLVDVLNPHDNLMYEIMNEPYFGEVSAQFQPAISGLITQAESTLPKKHLITQNIGNGSSRIEVPDPLVSVFNYHYAAPPHAIAENYDLNKPIGCNETGFAKDNLDATFRRQAWEFMLAGGALFNNLDFSFAAGNERGSGESQCPHTGGSHALRTQYGFLRRFLEELDFIRLRPANELIHAAGDAALEGYLLAEPGRQYAFYLAADRKPDMIGFSVDAGNYRFEIFDPLSCKPLREGTMVHSGGMWLYSLENELEIAASEMEIAIKLVRE